MKISVLGCGRWGSCIAWYLDRIGHEVLSGGLSFAPEFIQLKTYRKNNYLSFPDSIEISSDLEYSVSRAEVIVISISCQHLREYMTDISKYDLSGKTFVLCMKGIEEATGKRLSEVVSEFIDKDKTNVAVWVGPGHPQDYVRNIPNCMVIDSDKPEVKEWLVNEFNSELIRFYIGTDLIGTEIGAAAKNVIGICAGMLDGMGYTSMKGALMARATREISQYIKAMGGNARSAYGLCHLGDYEATLFSQWSHNRMYGEQFVKGAKFEKLAEGVMTTKAIYKVAKEKGIEMPIVNQLYEVLFNGKEVRPALDDLFNRNVKHEFDY